MADLLALRKAIHRRTTGAKPTRDELRRWALKPGAREPADAEWIVVETFWEELQKRFAAARAEAIIPSGPPRSPAEWRAIIIGSVSLESAARSLCPACGRDWGGPCPNCPREYRCAGDVDGREHAPVLFWCSPGDPLVCPVCDSGDVTFERVPAAPASKAARPSVIAAATKRALRGTLTITLPHDSKDDLGAARDFIAAGVGMSPERVTVRRAERPPEPDESRVTFTSKENL
jgi:hypothetical protein